MSVEFVDWDSPTFEPKKRAVAVVKKVIVPIVVMSNACAEGIHNLCEGNAWHVTKAKYVPCQCDCGCIVAEDHACDEAFQDFLLNADRDIDPEIYEANAFYEGWKKAKEYYAPQ